MSAVATAIAEAVKNLLAGETFSEPVTVKRVPYPVYDNRTGELETVQIRVTVGAQVMDLANRGRNQLDQTIEVGIAKMVRFDDGLPDAAAVDALVTLVEHVRDVLLRARQAEAACTAVEAVPTLYDHKKLKDDHVFMSLLRATFQALRTR